MADNSERIAEIQKILRTGATKVKTPDGVEVEYDFDELRNQLRELQATDDTHRGRRPVASSVNLGGF